MRVAYIHSIEIQDTITIRYRIQQNTEKRWCPIRILHVSHIGAPTTETNISRAFAYSRLLRGAPTEATPLYILYEHCI